MRKKRGIEEIRNKEKMLLFFWKMLGNKTEEELENVIIVFVLDYPIKTTTQ